MGPVNLSVRISIVSLLRTRCLGTLPIERLWVFRRERFKLFLKPTLDLKWIRSW